MHPQALKGEILVQKGKVTKRTASIIVDITGNDPNDELTPNGQKEIVIPMTTLPLDKSDSEKYLPEPIDDVAKALVETYKQKAIVTVVETFEVSPDDV